MDQKTIAETIAAAVKAQLAATIAQLPPHLAVLRSSQELLTKYKDINQSVISINLNDQERPP